MTSKAGTPWTVAGEVHPSAIQVADAPPITAPLIVLASQDEDEEVVKKFGEALTVPKFIDFYKEAPHVSVVRRRLNWF